MGRDTLNTLSDKNAQVARRKAALLNLEGTIYRLKGYLDRSQTCHQEGLALHERCKYKSGIAVSLNSLGLVYKEMDNLDRASEYLKQSFELKTHEKMDVSDTLLHLVSISIERGELEMAREYLTQLDAISRKEQTWITRQRESLAKALILGASHRVRHRAEAEILLTQIINDTVDYEVTIIALLHFCNLLAAELKTSRNQEVLDEFEHYTNRLFRLAHQQRSYHLMAEAYLLQSKLALMDLDLQRAKALLAQARILTEEKMLLRLTRKISSEYDALLDQLSQWQELVEQSPPLRDQEDLVRIEEIIVETIRKRAVDQPELMEEEPVLFLITAISGLSLYSKFLIIDSGLNEDLISGLLTAIRGLSSKVFDQVLERVRMGELTLLMLPSEPFLFCYLFRGQAYLAKQKLKEMLDSVREEGELWTALVFSEKSGKDLSPNARATLGNLVERIFSSE